MLKYNCPAKFEELLKTRVYPLQDALKNIIVAQSEAVDTVVMGLFGVGQRDFYVETKTQILGCSHVLLCGSTGSGKTALVKAVSAILGGTNKRVSGIPDAQASDISGSELFLLDSSRVTQHGPAFYANILLADEINRFSPRAQNAFIEMLAEQQITIGQETYKLKNPFFCVATMNPSENSRGISQISEALSDRFVYKVLMRATSNEEKVAVAKKTHIFNPNDFKQILSLDDVNEAREYFFNNIYVDDKVRHYCANLLNIFNYPKEFNLFKEEQEVCGRRIFKQEYPANDRCMLHLENAGMIYAVIQRRDYVTPHDISNVALRVLRGRLLINPSSVPALIELYNGKLISESDIVDYLVSKAVDYAFNV